MARRIIIIHLHYSNNGDDGFGYLKDIAERIIECKYATEIHIVIALGEKNRGEIQREAQGFIANLPDKGQIVQFHFFQGSGVKHSESSQREYDYFVKKHMWKLYGLAKMCFIISTPFDTRYFNKYLKPGTSIIQITEYAGLRKDPNVTQRYELGSQKDFLVKDLLKTSQDKLQILCDMPEEFLKEIGLSDKDTKIVNEYIQKTLFVPISIPHNASTGLQKIIYTLNLLVKAIAHSTLGEKYERIVFYSNFPELNVSFQHSQKKSIVNITHYRLKDSDYAKLYCLSTIAIVCFGNKTLELAISSGALPIYCTLTKKEEELALQRNLEKCIKYPPYKTILEQINGDDADETTLEPNISEELIRYWSSTRIGLVTRSFFSTIPLILDNVIGPSRLKLRPEQIEIQFNSLAEGELRKAISKITVNLETFSPNIEMISLKSDKQKIRDYFESLKTNLPISLKHAETILKLIVRARNQYDSDMSVDGKSEIKIAILTEILERTKNVLMTPTSDEIKNYQATAALLQKYNWGRIIAGSMMMLVGGLLAAVGILATLASCGIVAPLAALGIGGGAALAAAGWGAAVGFGIVGALGIASNLTGCIMAGYKSPTSITTSVKQHAITEFSIFKHTKQLPASDRVSVDEITRDLRSTTTPAYI